MAGLSSAKPKTGSNKRRLSDDTEVFVFPERKWVEVRLIGPMTSYGQIWFNILTNAGKKTSFPKVALNYDPVAEEFSGACPYYDSEEGRPTQKYIGNMIVRPLQEVKPAKQSKPTAYELKSRRLVGERWHLKEAGSKTWTPCRVYDWPATMIGKLQDLAEFNRVKDKKTGEYKNYPVDHPKYGRTIKVKFDSKKTGSDKWSVGLSDGRAPLTEEELGYCLQPLENLPSITPDSPKEAAREMKNLLPKILSDDKDDKKKDKKKDKYIEDSDGEDSDGSDGEEKPRKGKKAKPAKRRSSRDEDSDGDDSDGAESSDGSDGEDSDSSDGAESSDGEDSDGSDGEEKPRKGKGKAKPGKVKPKAKSRHASRSRVEDSDGDASDGAESSDGSDGNEDSDGSDGNEDSDGEVITRRHKAKSGKAKSGKTKSSAKKKTSGKHRRHSTRSSEDSDSLEDSDGLEDLDD